MPKQKNCYFGEIWERYLRYGLIFILLASCAPQPGVIPGAGSSQTLETESNLAYTKWMLVSFEKSGVETPVTVGSSITLEFDSQGQIGGSGGCNIYGTQYEVRDNMISFGKITRTLVACEQEGIGHQEQTYFQALELAGRFELASDRLTIWYGDQGDKLNFVAAANATPTVPPIAPSTSTPTAPLTPTAGSGSSEENPIRIAFEPGETSAEIQATIAARAMQVYVLHAQQGQQMSVEITSPNQDVLLSVVGQDGTPLKRYQNGPPRWAAQLPATQDYFLHAVSVGQATSYTLRVSIEPPPAQTRERVEFQPGATSATRSGVLSGGGVKEYELRGLAGQTMHVQTVGFNAPVEFTLTSPNGETWSGELQPSDVYIFTVQVILPHNGDYVVRLSVPQDTGATRYDVIFTISTISQPSTPPPVGSPERVNFAPGATSATRSGDLPAGGIKEYVVWADVGQSMHVQTVGSNAPVEFTLRSPAGETWSGELQPSDVYIFTVQVVLPRHGDYVVRLSVPPDAEATHFDVTFTITGPRSTQ